MRPRVAADATVLAASATVYESAPDPSQTGRDVVDADRAEGHGGGDRGGEQRGPDCAGAGRADDRRGLRRQGRAGGDHGGGGAGVVWPVERVLLEADPSGGDLAFRLRYSARAVKLDRRTAACSSLAADAREGLAAGALARYAQPTNLGVPVLKWRRAGGGRSTPMARLWPKVAAEAHAWPGTVIADLGRLHSAARGRPGGRGGDRGAAGDPGGAWRPVPRAANAPPSWRPGWGRAARTQPAGGRGGAARREAHADAVGAGAAGARGAQAHLDDPGGRLPGRGPARGGRRCGRVMLTKRLLGSDLLKSARALAQTCGLVPEIAAGGGGRSCTPAPAHAVWTAPRRRHRPTPPARGHGGVGQRIRRDAGWCAVSGPVLDYQVVRALQKQVADVQMAERPRAGRDGWAEVARPMSSSTRRASSARSCRGTCSERLARARSCPTPTTTRGCGTRCSPRSTGRGSCRSCSRTRWWRTSTSTASTRCGSATPAGLASAGGARSRPATSTWSASCRTWAPMPG